MNGLARFAVMVALFISAGVAACGKSGNEIKLPTPAPAPAGQGQGQPPAEWKNIRTFRDSLDTASLSFDPLHSKISVQFEHWSFDQVDADGAPILRTRSGFRAIVPQGYRPGDWIALEDTQREADFDLQVACDQLDCQQATLSLTKNSGQMTGTADIRFSRAQLLQSSFSAARARDRTTPRAHVGEALQTYPSVAHSTLAEIQGTQKTSFEVEILFTYRGWPGDAGYFTAKKATLRGRVAFDGWVNVGVSTQYPGRPVVHISAASRAQVTYRPQGNRLEVLFADREGLYQYIVGSRVR